MASSRSSDPDGGYVTAAAAVMSMGLALVATATVALAGAEYRVTQARWTRVEHEAYLDSVQLLAEVQLIQTPGQDRHAWSITYDDRTAAVLAEPEAAKLSLEKAGAALTDDTLAAIGVERRPLASALAGLALDRFGSLERMPRVFRGPAWQACARSLISPAGGEALQVKAATEPRTGEVDWKVGQLWRIRVTSPDGWSDDRVVRFLGDETHPAAVVHRSLRRTGAQESACDRYAH